MKIYLYGNMARAFFIMARALLIWPVHFYLLGNMARAFFVMARAFFNYGLCILNWSVLTF